MSNIIPDQLSTLFDSLAQDAVDEAIEQHRLNGQPIAISDNNGNVIEISPQDITPLAQKLQQRQQQALSTPQT